MHLRYMLLLVAHAGLHPVLYTCFGPSDDIDVVHLSEGGNALGRQCRLCHLKS